MRSVYIRGRRVLVYNGRRGSPVSPDGYGQTVTTIALKANVNVIANDEENAISAESNGIGFRAEVKAETSTDTEEDVACDIAIDITASANSSDGISVNAASEAVINADAKAAVSTESVIPDAAGSVFLEADGEGRISTDDTLGNSSASVVFDCKVAPIVAQPVNVKPDSSTIAIDCSVVVFNEPPAGAYSTVYVSMNDASNLTISIWTLLSSGAIDIEWGDGTITKNAQFGRGSHTYDKKGDYAIIIKPQAGTVYTVGRYVGPGASTSNYSLFGYPGGPANPTFEAFEFVGYNLSIINTNTFTAGSFKKIKILDGPTIIEQGAISAGHARGGTIDLPQTITTIKNANFPNTWGSIIIRATTPPANLGFNGMSNPGTTVPVYVPAASVQAYKEHADWSAHADYIFPIEE